MDQNPGHLNHAGTIDALEEELSRTVRLAEQTPGDLPIPTCPGWTSADLWEHLGTVHRWVTEIVRERPTERVSRRNIDPKVPTDGLWSPWMAEGADDLLAVLRDTSAEDPMWSWGADQHARWWARRQLHETVVHNADAALALGEEFDVVAPVAADGVCELLDNTAVRLTWPGAKPPADPVTIHLHATDAADPALPDAGAAGLGDLGEWMIELGDGNVSYTHGHGKGDVAVRAPVTTLMLLMNRRVDPQDFSDPGSTVGGVAGEVFGEPSVLAGALESLSLA
ncbi:MAG: maleylpyruvate isomerase family mycothiol-dependent enzyme [Microthrixaceae bacterium]